MEEKELVPTDESSMVNAWDVPSGQANDKVLVKNLPGQGSGNEVVAEQPKVVTPVVPETPGIPFIAPEIDFTRAMAPVDSNTQSMPVATPIEATGSIPNSFSDNSGAMPVEQPVISPVANPIIEQVSVAPEIVPVETPVVEPVVTVSPEINPVGEQQNLEQPVPEVTPIATAPVVPPVEPGYTVSVPENETPTQPFDLPETVVKPESVNQQQAILSDNGMVTSEQLSQNFGSIIDNSSAASLADASPIKLNSIDENGQAIEQFHDTSNNTFTNIFNAPANPEVQKFINPQTGTLEVPPVDERADLNAKVRSAATYRRPQKRLIPAGYEIGILVFILLFLFVMNIDKVSAFIDDFIFKTFY